MPHVGYSSLRSFSRHGEAVDNPQMKVRALALAAMVVVLLVGPMASTAHAATSQGCSGSISSAGSQIDTFNKVIVPGPGGTNAHPFQLYWADPVTWTGQTYGAVTDGTWRLTVHDASWLFVLGELLTGHIHGLTGSFTSGQGGTSFTNSFTPSSIEPVTLPGRYEVGFTVTDNGAVACTGTISVRVMDPPGHNPFWWLAFLLLIAGLIMLFVFGISKWTRPSVVRTNDRGERAKHTGARHVVGNTLAGSVPRDRREPDDDPLWRRRLEQLRAGRHHRPRPGARTRRGPPPGEDRRRADGGASEAGLLLALVLIDWFSEASSTPAHGRIGTDEVHGVLGVEGFTAGRTADHFLTEHAGGVVPAGALLAGRQLDHGLAVRLEHVDRPRRDLQAVEELEHRDDRGLLVGVGREIADGLDDVALTLA